jgi:SAM-dependent methyltransferase
MPTSAYALSFGSQAERYDRHRPSYPDAAIDFALASAGTECIVDVGAGTGKLTAGLVGRSRRLIAVEPDDRMRDVLRGRFSDLYKDSATVVSDSVVAVDDSDTAVDVLSGTAEATGLPDNTADAVVAGQAFHWFSRPQTDFEFGRILRPGGVCALIWNVPDANQKWVRELYAAIGDNRPPWTRDFAELDRAVFAETEEFAIDWFYELDGPESVLNLVHTWSHVIATPAGEQGDLDAAVRSLIKRTPELRGKIVRMPMHTTVARQRLL